jgi:hypothetical protein
MGRGQGSRCWPTPPTVAARPARRSPPPATPRRSNRSRGGQRCRAASPRRLRDRPSCRHGHLPGRPHRGHHSWRSGGVRLALSPRVRSASAAPAPRTARRWTCIRTRRNLWQPAQGCHPSLPGQLPPLAAHGRALDRLAGRQRPPPSALPRPGPQPARPVATGGRDRPAPTGHHGAGLMRCRVGARLTGSGPGVSNEGRLYGYSHPAWSACALEHRRFGSDIPRAQSESMTMMAAPEVGCSAAS